MRRSRNVFIIYIIMVLCVFALSGCSGADYEGKDLVDRAKKIHTEQDAAHITVSDRTTYEVLQEITYRFEVDVMQYMYIGRDIETGREYYEFNSGNELDTWQTGDYGWSAVARGSEGYYNYSRAKRHYFADGDLLLNDYPSAVKSAEIRNEAGGLKRVCLQYDDSRIAQYEQMSGVTGYQEQYGFDPVFHDGQCINMLVTYQKDGREYSYEIDIEYCDPEEPIKRVGLPAFSGEIKEPAQ